MMMIVKKTRKANGIENDWEGQSGELPQIGSSGKDSSENESFQLRLNSMKE